MDNSVALVQAYLRMNGYFTVTEYPVIEAVANGGYRSATDLDILAFRFPRAGHLIPGHGGSSRGDRVLAAPFDATIGGREDEPDMLIGEVKEGRAELNAAATDPAVLRAVFVRFGCCPSDQVDALVATLLREGEVKTHCGHRARLVAFGALPPSGSSPGFHVVLLDHVVEYLQGYLRDHWDVLHHACFKDPAVGFLVTLEKARRGHELEQGVDHSGCETWHWGFVHK